MTDSTLDPNEVLLAATWRLDEANALAIATTEDLATASDLFNEARGVRDAYERTRVAEKEPYLEGGRQVDARWKPILSTLDAAADAIAKKIGAFKREAERRAQEEQARLRAEQEKERLRLEKQAERAEAKGLPDTAGALIRAAETMQPAIVQSAMPNRVGGLSLAENWTFEIEDESKLPREYMMPDVTAIRRTVKALKGKAAIPGVRAYKEDSIRRGR